MTKTYNVTIWRSMPHYGVIEVTADSAADAIAKVRADQNAIDDCDMEDCGGEGQPVHYIAAEPLEDCPNKVEGDTAELDLNLTYNAARAMLAALKAILQPFGGLEHRKAALSAIAAAEAAGITPPHSELAAQIIGALDPTSI